jgi:hypothetical protein
MSPADRQIGMPEIMAAVDTLAEAVNSCLEAIDLTVGSSLTPEMRATLHAHWNVLNAQRRRIAQGEL